MAALLQARSVLSCAHLQSSFPHGNRKLVRAVAAINRTSSASPNAATNCRLDSPPDVARGKGQLDVDTEPRPDAKQSGSVLKHAALGLFTVGCSLQAGTALADAGNSLTHGLSQALSLGFPALNPESTDFVRTIVWLDFWLAVLFNVIAPQWIFACSLFMVTVYLQIGGWSPGFNTELASVLVTPVALWWWKDLGEEIDGADDPLTATWRTWRNVATVVCLWIAASQVFTGNQQCALEPSFAGGIGGPILANPTCAAWLEPEYYFNQLLHPWLDPGAARAAAQVGLVVYAGRWLQLLAFELPACGRFTYKNERSSSVWLTRVLGFLGKDQ
eukprot:jgi/Mesvir1/22393/Mv17883-RA.3